MNKIETKNIFINELNSVFKELTEYEYTYNKNNIFAYTINNIIYFLYYTDINVVYVRHDLNKYISNYDKDFEYILYNKIHKDLPINKKTEITKGIALFNLIDLNIFHKTKRKERLKKLNDIFST